MTTKQKPRVIVVPDVPHPTLCWRQTFTGPVPNGHRVKRLTRGRTPHE